MKRTLRNNSLGIVLAILFLTSWAGQAVMQWTEFQHEQQSHGQEATVSEFMAPFWSATLENWQSEFLQLLSFVVLTSFLIQKGSPESKDSDEKMEARLGRIETLLKKS